MTAESSHAVEFFQEGIELPEADNTSQGLKILRAANEQFRQIPWPTPFDRTRHTLRLGDARELSHIADETVHLIVTSPPYWTLKEYPETAGNLVLLRLTRHFLMSLTRLGGNACVCWCPAGGSVALSVMCAFLAVDSEGISSCRFTRTFRSGRVHSGSMC